MRKSFKIKFICIFSVIDILLILLYFNACRYLIEIASSSFQSYMSTAVYSAVTDGTEKEDYLGICNVTFGSDGKVTYIGTDVFKANVLSAKLAAQTFEKLSAYAEKGVDVPLGAFTGIRLLSGTGKSVNIKLISIASVKCAFVSKVESAGINQTRQTLYLNVEPQIRIVAAGMTELRCENLQIVCYDNLIVGEVPNVYFNTGMVASGSYFGLRRFLFVLGKNL